MKNLTRLCTLALGVSLLLLGTACSSTQPVGEQFDDAAITTKVEAKMAANSDVSAFNVDVHTNEGVVRLSGTVKTAAAKAEAEKVARGTEGVRQVINDIEVGERDLGDRMSDTVITTKIKAKITVNPDLNPFNINVDTKEGVVTLRGTVTSMNSKEEAERIARDTDGVERVQNMLDVEEGS